MECSRKDGRHPTCEAFGLPCKDDCKRDPLEDYITLRSLNTSKNTRVIFSMHMPTRQNVILKFLYGAAKAEAKIHKRLSNHPRIVSVLETIELGAWVCLVLPYVCGGDLIDAMSPTGNMEEWRALKYLRQLAEALSHLHNCNIAHCDVKLDNLVCDEYGDLRLIDFGSAVHYTNGCLEACGGKSTLNYMAPEMANSKGDFHHIDYRACDVYSAGIVLFCLLTRYFPWKEAQLGDPNFEKFLAVHPAVGSIPGWDKFKPSTQTLLASLLHPDPRKRPTSQEVVKMLAGHTSLPNATGDD